MTRTILMGATLAALLAVGHLAGNEGPVVEEEGAGGAMPNSALFCFWNVENMFDDRLDKWPNEPDRGFDRWFAEDKEALPRKLEKLCEVLLSADFNAGKGPDILAMAELESYRAAELIANALNKRLKADLHYKAIVWKDVGGGRGIATGVISRLPIAKDRSRIHGRKQRILEVHVKVGGQDLAVLATHWSSRISDKTGKGRANYADVIYGRYKAILKENRDAKVVVCGDFNDDPDDDSVKKHLHGTGDKAAVLRGGANPLMYNLFYPAFTKGQGTLYYRGKAHVFDQVHVSPGLLRGPGLRVDESSAKIVRRIEFKGRPDRFGGPEDKRPWRNRGASDHFPVAARLMTR